LTLSFIHTIFVLSIKKPIKYFMKDYRHFLTESTIDYTHQLLSFLSTHGYEEVSEIPTNNGFIVKKNNFIIYSSDRIKTKEDLHNFLNMNRITYTEKSNSESTVPVTIFGKLKCLYKPLAGKGRSGGSNSQTIVQETTQNLVLSLTFNILKRQITENDLVDSDLLKAYELIDKNDNPLNELIHFMYSSKDWKNTFIETANILFKKFYANDKTYKFERGTKFIESIYTQYKNLSKEMGIKANKNKWNPSDIWLVSTELNNFPKCDTLIELNATLKKLYLSKDLIGVSLKKIDGKPNISVYNESNTLTTNETSSFLNERILDGKKYKTFMFSSDSKDAYLITTDNIKIQFRSFGNMVGYQGEIKGKSASHGKINYNIINYFLNRLTKSKLPKDDNAVKVIRELIRVNDKSILTDFIYKWNIHNKRKIADINELIVYATESSWDKKTKTNNPLDWIYSNYLSMLLIETVEGMSDENKDIFINNVFRYASSESDFSSIFVKVY
jgi:hypothetical protein